VLEEQSTDESSSIGKKSFISGVKKKLFGSFVKKEDILSDDPLVKHEAKKELDKQLVQALGQKNSRWPNWQQLRKIGHFLSPKEDKIIKILGLLILLTVVFLSINVWFFTLETAPAHGGEYSEGLVGSPKYINPVLASASDVDLDIVSLLFCGLMKRSENGLEMDLAESYTVSEDQKEYTFKIKPGIKWHNSDQEVTVDDILLTFDLIKDPDVGSPLAVSFQGISADKIDDYNLRFVLKEPFTPFLSTLTFGILPSHLWFGIDPANMKLAELNLKPVGCGPFKFDSLKKDKNGSIKSFTLIANSDYYLGEPYLEKITFKIYPDFISLGQALINKNITSASFLPKETREEIFGESNQVKGSTLRSLSLPQYSAIFFNQEDNIALKEKNVRSALYKSLDRQRIVRQALDGEAKVIHAPILAGSVGYHSEIAKHDYSPAEATALLDSAKWKAIPPNDYITWQREQEKSNLAEGEEYFDRSDEERLAEISDQEYFRKKGDQILTINLTIVDDPESKVVADIIKENWQAVGVQVNLVIFSPESVLRQAIRPRDYQALLYSEIVGYDPDPYPFWHSSQNSETGLNLAVFTDKRVDKYIEAARQTNDVVVREENYKKFQDILAEEVPAIFLYSPTYSYVVDSDVKGLKVQKIFIPADRLSDMWGRYIEVKKVWSQ